MQTVFQPYVFQQNVFQKGTYPMAAAPATAAAALALLTTTTGKVNAVGFDLGQIVGATNDASCLMLTKEKTGTNTYFMFVSAATSTADAGVVAIARKMKAAGADVFRYVIGDTALQTFSGPDATATFSNSVVVPSDYEWLDAVNNIMENHAIA